MATVKYVRLGSNSSKNFSLVLPKRANIGNVFLSRGGGQPKIPVTGDWKGEKEINNFYLAEDGDEVPYGNTPLGVFRDYALYLIK